jgi:hypothetical protein
VAEPATDPVPVEPDPPPAPAGDPAAGDPAADDLAGWADVVEALYAQRARAWSAADGALLAAVYASDSTLLQRDSEQLSRLAATGQTVAGFDPTVLQVTSVRADGDRVLVTLVDEVPAHRVVAAGTPGSAGPEVAGRGAAEVAMTLQRTADGWRIAEAARAG